MENWTEAVWPALEHFAVYAGRKVAAGSPGAWVQLCDALDAAEAGRFPSDTAYGNASACGAGTGKPPRPDRPDGVRGSGPRDRRGVFGQEGAVVSDMGAATGGVAESWNRLGFNDIGLRIWSMNYGQYMPQLNASGTSVGRWRVGAADPGPWGNYARMTDSHTGKTSMTFELSRGVFNSTAAFASFNSTAVYLRVGFFDKGGGMWQLKVGYSKSSRGELTYGKVGKVVKSDNGEWVEAQAALSALAVPSGFTLQDTSHLRLADTDAGLASRVDDDTFGWLEASKIPFTYNFTARVINITS